LNTIGVPLDAEARRTKRFEHRDIEVRAWGTAVRAALSRRALPKEAAKKEAGMFEAPQGPSLPASRR